LLYKTKEDAMDQYFITGGTGNFCFADSGGLHLSSLYSGFVKPMPKIILSLLKKKKSPRFHAPIFQRRRID
jgi:hypothetical protein